MSGELITAKEISSWLKQDPMLKILFVEGKRDLALWRKIAPITERKNSKVFAATAISQDSDKDGNRGKLIALANELKELGFSERVLIFIDADNDHVLEVAHAENIRLTDFRDIESYAFNEKSLNTAINIGLAKDDINIKSILRKLENLCYPIGVMRAVSARHDLKLAFQKTFVKNGRKRFICHKETETLLKGDLLRTLLQNSNIPLSKLAEIEQITTESQNKYNDIEKRKILHGKDWTHVLSYLMNVEVEVVEPLIFVSIEFSKDEHPNLNSVRSYLTTSLTSTH